MPLTTDERVLALSRSTIGTFDKANGGVHPGFRPVHAKGVLLTGVFTPSPEAALNALIATDLAGPHPNGSSSSCARIPPL
jgi:hypothetical protein